MTDLKLLGATNGLKTTLSSFTKTLLLSERNFLGHLRRTFGIWVLSKFCLDVLYSTEWPYVHV